MTGCVVKGKNNALLLLLSFSHCWLSAVGSCYDLVLFTASASVRLQQQICLYSDKDWCQLLVTEQVGISSFTLHFLNNPPNPGININAAYCHLHATAVLLCGLYPTWKKNTIGWRQLTNKTHLHWLSPWRPVNSIQTVTAGFLSGVY